MSSRLLVHASLVGVAASWGLVFVGVHELLPVLSAVQLVTLRFLIISLAFMILFALKPSLRVLPTSRADWIRFFACGVLAVPGSQLSVVEAQNYLSPQLASLVVAAAPVMTALLAAAVLDERLTLLRCLGSALALLGVAFIVLYGSNSGGGIGHAALSWGALLAVITPISWSIYTVISRPLSDHYPAIGTVGLSLTMGTVLLLPFSVSAARALPGLSGGDWVWLVFLGIGGSMLPYLIWYWSLQTLTANGTGAYMYAIPPFAMFFSWLILHRTPTEVAWIGSACVLLGVVLTQTHRRQRVAPVEPVVPLVVGEVENA